MSADVSKTEIAGLKITTMKLPPRKAMRIGVKLLKFALPALAAAGVTDEEDINDEMLSKIGVRALAEMDEDQVDDLLCKLLVGTTIIRTNAKGEPSKFELHDPDQIDQAFAGKFGAMLECGKWVMGFNFAGFFSEGSKTPKDPGVEEPTS